MSASGCFTDYRQEMLESPELCATTDVGCMVYYPVNRVTIPCYFPVGLHCGPVAEILKILLFCLCPFLLFNFSRLCHRYNIAYGRLGLVTGHFRVHSTLRWK